MKMSQTLATKFSKAKLLTGGVLLATALSVGLPATSSATGMNGNFGRDNDFRMHNHRRCFVHNNWGWDQHGRRCFVHRDNDRHHDRDNHRW